MPVFSRVVLDAPDVPAWYFGDVVARAVASGVHVLHLFNRHDELTELSRQRRNLDTPSPGNAAVPALLAPHALTSMHHDDVAVVESVDCSSARASNKANHDCGLYDGFVLMEQRDLFAAVPPHDRLLEPRGGGLWALRGRQ